MRVGLRVGWAGTAALCLMLWPASGWAIGTRIELIPPTTSISLTVWGMGMFPLHGRFERFSGSLSVDPAVPGGCSVSLDIAVASLHMGNGRLTQAATGPLLLDAGRYPTLHYGGTCSADATTGALTLHGVTRPVTLKVTREGAALMASGTLLRGAFGVDGYPGLVGRQVEMHVSVTLPHPL